MKEVTEAFWIHMNSAGGHENSATGYVVPKSIHQALKTHKHTSELKTWDMLRTCHILTNIPYKFRDKALNANYEGGRLLVPPPNPVSPCAAAPP